MNTHLLARCAVALLAFAPACLAQDRPQAPREIPSITVTGRGESASRPDRAVVRLGATAQAKEAAAAQAQVNEVMTRAIDKIKGLDIPPAAIQTSGLSLQPIYSQEPPRPTPEEAGRIRAPRIVAYQASNTIAVNVDDLAKIGAVIDAGVAAGANEIQGVSFELQDETTARLNALAKASRQARQKAEAIARALDVNLGDLIEVVEGGAEAFRPQMQMARGMDAAASPTPVEPGQVRVEATLTVRYRVQDGRGPALPGSPGRAPKSERQ